MCYVASDLGQHRLPVSLLLKVRHKGVKRTALSIDMLLLSYTGCKGIALISGSNPVADDQLNASSVLDDNHGPFRSRLNQRSTGSYAGAWIPRYMDKHQFIQVTIWLTSLGNVFPQNIY